MESQVDEGTVTALQSDPSSLSNSGEVDVSVHQDSSRSTEDMEASPSLDQSSLSSGGFPKTIMVHIEQNYEEQLKMLLQTQSGQEDLKTHAWDLVSQLCELLTYDNEQNAVYKVDLAAMTLEYMAKVANPKELLVALLEQADHFKDDVKFKALLLPVQSCLRRLPDNRGHSLAIALETLYAHLEALPLPKECELEGEERLLLEMDEDVIRINDVLSAFLEFFEPFAVDVSFLNSKAAKREGKIKESRELTRFLLQLLFRPVAYLDLSILESNGNHIETSARINAKKLMTILSAVRGDHHKTLSMTLAENESIVKRRQNQYKRKHVDRISEEFDEVPDELEHPVSQLALSCLSFLVFGEGIGIEYLPAILAPDYLLEFNLQFIAFLISRPEATILAKGVALLTARLQHVASHYLDADLLEWSNMQEVVEGIVNVVVSCPVKDVRQFALSTVPLLLDRFNAKGRNKFIYFILNRTKHPGMYGYATGLLKNEIDVALKCSPPGPHFIGSHVERLLNTVFCLPSGAETDLLEQSERIMPSLNLLRYLILRDPPDNNVTGIWKLLPNIKKSYLDTLRSAINLSRAHYKMEEEKTRKGVYMKAKAAGEPEMILNVGGQPLPELSREDQLRVLTLATHTFDMMDSVLGRVSEIIFQHQKTSR